jgi:hypothetical protein
MTTPAADPKIKPVPTIVAPDPQTKYVTAGAYAILLASVLWMANTVQDLKDRLIRVETLLEKQAPSARQKDLDELKVRVKDLENQK